MMFTRSKSNQFFEIELERGLVEVTARWNKRAKRIILRIDAKSGLPIVTLPWAAHIKEAKRFVASRTTWIEDQLRAKPQPVDVRVAKTIMFEGERFSLHFTGIPPRKIHIDRAQRQIIVGGPADMAPRRLLGWLKDQARATLTEASKRHAKSLGLQFKKVRITDTISRWGSCSSKGNLNYSWRLILAPPEILQYVAAHEVAHLEEMNHSSAFWDLVASCHINWKQDREWLHQNGAALHAVTF